MLMIYRFKDLIYVTIFYSAYQCNYPKKAQHPNYVCNCQWAASLSSLVKSSNAKKIYSKNSSEIPGNSSVGGRVASTTAPTCGKTLERLGRLS